MFATYSLILATFLGTMGLPHVLGALRDQPGSGAAARRTTLVVLGLVGMFYLFPPCTGTRPGLHATVAVTGRTDAWCSVLPAAALGDSLAGQLLERSSRPERSPRFSPARRPPDRGGRRTLHDVIGKGSLRDFRVPPIVAGASH